MKKMFEGNRVYAALINKGWTEKEIVNSLKTMRAVVLNEPRKQLLSLEEEAFIHEFCDNVGNHDDLFDLVGEYIRHTDPDKYKEYRLLPFILKETRVIQAIRNTTIGLMEMLMARGVL